MVASLNMSDRFMPPPEDFLAGRKRVVRFTRSEVLAMVRQGIIPEDASIELLNGLLVLKDRSASDEDPFRVAAEHVDCVERLSDLRTRINSPTRHVESQQPLVCSETHVPLPDMMVLRGTLAQYSDLPQAADAFCVIEVADSSYERDAGEKLIGYARAGIEQYIIVNLRNRTAEVYTQPDSAHGTYAAPRVVQRGESISLRVGPNEWFEVSTSEFIPAPAHTTAGTQ